MAKEVIEPQIINPGQVEPRQEKPQNRNTKVRFYHTSSGGCLGLILFAFVFMFMAIPLLIFNLFRKKK